MDSTENLAHKICKALARNAGSGEYTKAEHAAVVRELQGSWAAPGKDPVQERVEKNYAFFVKFVRWSKATSFDALLKVIFAHDMISEPMGR